MTAAIADLVENMNLEEPSGEPSPEPTPSPDQNPTDGTDDIGHGTEEPEPKPGDKGTTDKGSGGDGKGAPRTDNNSPSSEGYLADEVDDDEPITQEKTQDTPQTGPLTPELQYVVDRLPVLSVRGKDRSYQVKAAGQLPDDFEFATKREELVFNQALAAQEFKAQDLLKEYNQKQQQDTYKKYSDQENTDIRHDIGDLQREGDLPRFQYQPTDRRFNDDPAVKEVQKVMDYMNEKNEAYTKNGRPYRITFRDAYNQMPKQTPKEDPAQKKEDAERKEVTRRTSPGRTTATNAPAKPKIARNMEDLMARIDNFDFA